MTPLNPLFRVGQINLQKSKTASAELNSRRYHVTLITEPYAYKGIVRLLDARAGTVTSAAGTSPRAAVRCGVNHWPAANFTDRDMATVVAKICNVDVYFASVYLDIEMSVRKNLMENLVEHCRRGGHPLVIGMDSNSHSTAWGAEEDNARGVELEALFIAWNLEILNVGSDYTFVSARSRSRIDITVVNQAARRLQIDGWRVRKDESFSDHKYIEFTCGKYSPTNELARNYNKMDWGAFGKALKESLEPNGEHRNTLWDVRHAARNEGDLGRAAADFTSELQTILDITCPKKAVMQRRPNSWWNQELEESRQRVRELSKSRTRSLAEGLRYKLARNRHRKLIAAARKKSWQTFCSSAESAKDVSQIVKSLQQKPARIVGLLVGDNGPTETPKEALDLLMRTHFPECTDRLDEPPVGVRQESSDVADYITTKLVKDAIRSFGPRKAPGPDGFHPMVLQQMPEEVVETLTELYKRSIQEGTVPSTWREMKVIFLPKEGKDDYASPKAYRPITLSSFLLKTMERVILWYLLEKVIELPLAKQHAYTAGLSTETALSTFVDDIEKAIYRSQYVLAVSLDCSGAFDRIGFDSAARALRKHRVPEEIITWYNIVLRYRKVTADLQGEQMTVRPGRGSPQGGILSPLIWNLIIDSLLSTFLTGPVKALGYADDTLLYITGVDPSTMAQFMQKALDRTLSWGRRNGLSFNPTKTTTVLFTRSRRKVKEPDLWMEGKKLEYSDEMKYLGVTVQKRMSWANHVNERVRKAGKLMNMVRNVIGQKWGLDPDKTLWTHTAIVRPKVSYASMVWAHGIGAVATKKLEQLQRKVLLGTSAAMRSTPSAAMEAILGLPPLDLFVMGEALKARARTRERMKDTWDGVSITANKGVAKGHRRMLDDKLKQLVELGNIEQVPSERSTMVWEKAEGNSLEMFTDGACTDGVMGLGWVLYDGPSLVAGGSGNAGAGTPYRAELAGLDDSLLWLISNPHKLKNRQLCLVTDCQSAVAALKAPRVKDAQIKNILDQAKLLATLGKVGIRWCQRGTDERNTMANAMARQASRRDPLEPDIGVENSMLGEKYIARDRNPRYAPVSLSEVKGRINSHITDEWQKRWSQSGPSTAKRFFPKVNGGGLKKLRKLSRFRMNELFQFGTGHGLFGGHLRHWKEIDDTCQLCLEEEETSAHLMWDCPALAYWREADTADEMEQRIIELAELEPVRELMQARGEQVKVA
jgi:ribonuclease HI